MALATMADLALGTALRSRLSPGQLLATVSLTLVLTRPANGTVTAEANVLHVDPGGGTAVCDLVDGAGRFGHAVGSFAAQRNPGATGLTITPWEHPSPPRGLPLNGGMALAGDLTTAEHAAVEAAVSAGERAHQGGTQYCDELLDVSVSLLDEDRCLGTSPVTPALANRAGTVQGGALLALVLAVARPLVPSGTWQLRELSYNFLRPASEPALEVRARARRRARRSVVVTADVLCSAMDTGLAVLRFAPVEAGS
jgi:acyl-coenzyme A thioesterase PaaI-like protein